MRERLLILALAFLTCSNASLSKRIRIEFLKVNITDAESTCSSNITDVLGPRLSVWTRKAIARYLNYEANSSALALSSPMDNLTDDAVIRRTSVSDEDLSLGDGNNYHGWSVSQDEMNGVKLERSLRYRSTRSAPVRSPVRSPTRRTSNTCSCSASGSAISCAIYYCAQFTCNLCQNSRRKLQNIYDDAFLPSSNAPQSTVDMTKLTLFVQNQIRWRSRRWLVNNRADLHGCFGNFRKIRMFVHFDAPTVSTPIVVK